MASCGTCGASLSGVEAMGECPLCGSPIETSEDRAIARSIQLPRNWSANMDSFAAALDEEFGEEEPPASPRSATSTATTEGPAEEESAGGSAEPQPEMMSMAESLLVDEVTSGGQSDTRSDSTSGQAGAETGAEISAAGTGADSAADDSGQTAEAATSSAGSDTDSGQSSAAPGVSKGLAELARQAGMTQLDEEARTSEKRIASDTSYLATLQLDNKAVEQTIDQSLGGDDDQATPGTSLKLNRPRTGHPTPPAGMGGLGGLADRMAGDSRKGPAGKTDPGFDDNRTVANPPSDPGSIRDSTLMVRPLKFGSSLEDNQLADFCRAEPGEKPDYELLSIIGEGGMGRIYRARQMSIDRQVAVKTLKPTMNDAETRQKFLSEAVVTGDLDHPNIVPIYDLGSDDEGALFYSMKRVVGTPWMDVIGSKSQTENLSILMRVADAVAFAHSRGVIHRDLKPENIMLGEFGEVLVMDWGLALTLEQFNREHGITQAGGLGGTPAYMAPEMLLGEVENIGVTSDIYLLGAILYEIITGRPPHHGRNARECLMAVASNKIVPTKETGELVDIALRCMCDLPEDRYQEVKDFQDAIRAYQSHSESILLSTRAEDDLALAMESGDYQDYARALFAFEEAVELWDGNQSARVGLVITALAYARIAWQKGDYDLGLSLLKPEQPQHTELHGRLLAALKEREARQHRLATIRRLAVALVAVVLVTVTGAFFWIQSEAQRALRAEEVASQQRDAAEAATLEAETRRVEADSARTRAESSEASAQTARQQAIQEALNAKAEKQRAEEQKQRAELAQQAEEYEAYIAQIGLAGARIDENAFDSARGLLTSCSPELRNWEWGRLMYLCSQSVQVFNTATPVESIDQSLDGRLLASGGWNGNVQIREVASGEVIRQLEQLKGNVYSVAFSPDASRLAVGCADPDASLQLRDVATGELLRNFAGHTDAVLSVEFSADGRRLLSSSFDGTARLWDVETGRQLQLYRGHTWWVWSAGFSPDERQIVTAGQDGVAIVWDTASGRASAPFTGHEGPVFTAAFSPDGQSIASGGNDRRVLLWKPENVRPYDYQKLATGEPVEQPPFRVLEGHSGEVRSVSFSRDGSLLASTSHDNTIRVWNVQSGQTLRTFRGHDSWVRDAVFDAETRRVFSGSHDTTARVWSIADYEEFRVLEGRVLAGHTDAILDVAVSPDSSRVVTASRDRTALVWNLHTGQLQSTLEEGHAFLTSTAVFFGDGKRLATAAADSTARIWNLATGTQTQVFSPTGRTAAMAVSPDGRLLLTGSETTNARLWDAEQGTLLRELAGHPAEVTAVAFSADGRQCLSGDATGRCRLWNTATGELLARLNSHTRRITAAAFLPDGSRVLTASGDNTVAQWNLDSHLEQTSLVLSHPDGVDDLVLMPDGHTALTACADGRVRCWDVAEAKVVRTLHVPGEKPGKINISVDGQLALTVDSHSRNVRLWNPATGVQLHPPAAELPAQKASAEQKADRPAASPPFLNLAEQNLLVWTAALTRDGNGILTVGGNGARLWDVKTGRELLSFSPHGAVASARFSPDGREVITGSFDSAARVWNLETGKAIEKLSDRHAGAVTAADFSPDGRQLLTAGDDGLIQIWDAATGAAAGTFSGHTGPIHSAVWSPDGTQILSASADRTARLWDVATRKTIHVLRGHAWGVLDAAFSTDGTRIVTGSEDNTARLWNAVTGLPDLDQPLASHTAAVTSVAFSPDGRRVLTGSRDETGKLWDSTTGKEILSLAGHQQEVTSVAFSPDGRHAVTGSLDGRAIVWMTTDWRTDRKAEQATAE